MSVEQYNITIDTSLADKKTKELVQFWNKKRKYIRAIMRKPIAQVKREVANAAKASMKSDPRKAYKAVRGYVWKRGDLGMTVSLVGNSRSKSMGIQPKPKKLHRYKSDRSKQIDGYMGADRAFVLRILNVGRSSFDAKMPSGRTARRGAIMPRKYFHRAADGAIEWAVGEVSERIAKLIHETAEAIK